jgi:hypothetical protein
VKREQGSLLRPVRGTLEAVGLGGAAHPVRRLQHPGGEMMFPFGGRSGWSRSEIAKLRAANPEDFPLKLSKSERAREASREAAKVAGFMAGGNAAVLGSAYAYGKGTDFLFGPGSTDWTGEPRKRKGDAPREPATHPHRPSKRRVQAKYMTFLVGVDQSVRAGTMGKGEATRARKWAVRVSKGPRPLADLQRGIEALQNEAP